MHYVRTAEVKGYIEWYRRVTTVPVLRGNGGAFNERHCASRCGVSGSTYAWCHNYCIRFLPRVREHGKLFDNALLIMVSCFDGFPVRPWGRLALFQRAVLPGRHDFTAPSPRVALAAESNTSLCAVFTVNAPVTIIKKLSVHAHQL